MLLFILLYLTSTVDEIFTGETPPPVDETEEGGNFTLRWDSLTQTNTTLTNMICFLLLSPPKVLYQKINGAEVPESQDGQFSGRVQSDKRGGRLRLHLSRLRTEDSGSYRCDLAAYNQVLRKWEQTSVNFVLNVTKTRHRDIPLSLNTPKPELGVSKGINPVDFGIKAAIFAPSVAAVVAGILVIFKSDQVRMKMISLLLLILSSCLCAATFVVNVTQSSYEAEENQNITLEWTFTSRTQGNWKNLFIICEFRTSVKSGIIYVHRDGVEIPDFQHDQFSGRVQSDKDVLREGRIRLHVSRLRTEDSGLYWCDVKTEDGFNSAECRLNVTAAADQIKTQRPTLTPEPERQ